MAHIIPQELQDMIYRQAYSLLGINFFALESLESCVGLRPSGRFALTHRGIGPVPVPQREPLCMLRPPCVRPKDNTLWWMPDESVDNGNLSCPRTTFYNGQNPPAYTTRFNLNRLFKRSAFGVGRTLTRHYNWDGMHLKTQKTGTTTSHDGRPMNKIPNRISYHHWFGTPYGPTGFERFFDMEELFFLDYAVRLKAEMAPGSEARRWRGGKYDFFEVLEGDGAWERIKDDQTDTTCVEDFDVASAIADAKEHHCLLENVRLVLRGHRR
ncbi:hypothetical protein B0T14DRAFT_563614 [Immersiella caudata]|uniref:Uncharacterized protein n=1 Tax=Immersiella caudata TaxID=314043 RepID=A0AA39X5W0_9PEZI|nr:hypothetical protein B0T14DRAFT_563614 [Immersiella caudata]